MSVLVTGGAGYIGSVVVERLLDRGEQVVVLDNLSRGYADAVPSPAHLVIGDICDREILHSLFRDHDVRAVMHFAAFSLVGESVEQPEIYYRNNVTGSLTLIEAALAAGVERLIFSSSGAVYGNLAPCPIRETAAARPINPYGETKLAVERALEWLHRAHRWTYFALRYFNAAGATEQHGERHQPETHLIPRVLMAAAGETDGVAVLGDDYATPDGTCIRDYVHVEDLAEAHILTLQAPAQTSGSFNVGTGRGHSVRELIAAVRKVTARPVREIPGPRRSGDPAELVADPSKIQQTLGWQPQQDLESILRSAWTFKLRHGASPRSS